MFICNLSRNDVTFEVAMEPLPKVLYFRHRQKRDPVEFYGDTISAKRVIEFVKENTVFDWVEEEEL